MKYICLILSLMTVQTSFTMLQELQDHEEGITTIKVETKKSYSDETDKNLCEMTQEELDAAFNQKSMCEIL